MVVPAAMPLTIPAVSIVATPVAPLFQVPPVTDDPNVTVAPTHIFVVPEIIPATAQGLTVTTAVAAVVPQLLVRE